MLGKNLDCIVYCLCTGLYTHSHFFLYFQLINQIDLYTVTVKSFVVYQLFSLSLGLLGLTGKVPPFIYYFLGQWSASGYRALGQGKNPVELFLLATMATLDTSLYG